MRLDGDDAGQACHAYQVKVPGACGRRPRKLGFLWGDLVKLLNAAEEGPEHIEDRP